MSLDRAGRDTLVVVPCYNESRRLDVGAIERYVASHPRVRFLFIDDGSTDSTASVLSELAERQPGAVTWRTLAVNSGKAEAVRQGVVTGLSESVVFVGYWDADLATPLESIDDFLDVLDREPELLGVLGSRIQRLGARIDRRPLRHYAGRLFATLASITLGMPVYDTQCGAKMFRAGPEVAHAFDQPFRSRWIFDVEMLARMKRASAPESLAPRLFELPLRQWQDVAGSKLSTAHAAAAFLDLWEIFRKYR